ncbi:MAG TPA: hypothetical protein PLS00_00280 [Niabella sp.]|jgi:hypothetical protein|nr:hypothetical protein [Niabella sp.]
MLDFFNNDCKESPRKNVLFGICEGNNSGRAYTEIENPDTWIATVRNERGLETVFTAIDKCVIKDNEYQNRKRCDGMLTTDEHIYLIELKDRNYSGVDGLALQQLESTLQFLYEIHGELVDTYRYKKAFACNKSKPRFVTIDAEQKRRFFDMYRFRIDIQADVIIV